MYYVYTAAILNNEVYNMIFTLSKIQVHNYVNCLFFKSKVDVFQLTTILLFKRSVKIIKKNI